MPELPEVETIRRKLTDWLSGRTITNLAFSGHHRGVAEEAIRSVIGYRIGEIRRLGKYLTLHAGPQLLVVHLGMSGRFLFNDTGVHTAGPHDHVAISTDDGKILTFQDHRRFGRMFISPLDNSALPPLGPDPLCPPLTASQLAQLLGRRQGQLKPLLMNQSVISGIGNIYVCEILWAARLSPFRGAQTLEHDDYSRLAGSLVDVLSRALAAGGSTLDDYRHSTGAMGDFDLCFSVYARAGIACSRCASLIGVDTLAGRATYWCAGCQL